jgi:hypothetical protein
VDRVGVGGVIIRGRRAPNDYTAGTDQVGRLRMNSTKSAAGSGLLTQ